jgi:hypothetical protein
LARKGFKPIEDPEWREKAFGEMPDVSRSGGSALISEDHTTFALRLDGDWRYYGLGVRTTGGQIVKRALWERLGFGWEAFSHFESLEFPQFEASNEKNRKMTDWSDNRRLNY